MKKTNYLMVLFVAAGLIFTSCDKDDELTPTGVANNSTANAQNATENNKTSLSDLDQGIQIGGATKKTGTPPSPTNNVNFVIGSKTPEGFQNAGFDIDFSSTDNVAGAYIVFKNTDGNTSGNYFDIPVSAFKPVYKSNIKSKKKKTFFKSNAKAVSNSKKIAVTFNSMIPAGEFCYDICLYDASNNVSSIETKCVTVEAWGGYTAIVGDWILDSSNFDDDYKSEIECNSGQTFTALDEISSKREILISFAEDGSYFLTWDEKYKYLNDDASAANCSAIYYEEEAEKAEEIGNWAYNEDNETLTVVTFSYKDLLEPEFNEEYPNGDLAFEGVKAEVINNQLVLTETWIENGVTETEVYHLNRK